MVPPQVMAVSRSPWRGRNLRFTASRCTSAWLRPRRVENPSASICTTARVLSRGSASRYGQAWRNRSNSASSSHSPQASSAAICCASTSSGLCGMRRRSSSSRRTESRSAVHSTRSSRDNGKDPALGQPAHRVAGTADPLQQSRDGARRGDLTHEVDVTDVDAELQRRGRDQRLQLAALELLLGVEALLARHAAMMRSDLVLAETLGQRARHALGQAPGVDEHQRRAVLLDQAGQPLVDLAPHLARHHRLER